jgi:4'-phosphopantetheinyl transferase
MRSFLHIWQADLAGPPNTWLAAETSLRPAELARRARLRTPELRQTYGRAHAFLRAVLALYTELPPSSLAFAAASQGKPLLLGSDLHFNLSYRAERAVLAVSDIGPVGADVEQLRLLPDADALVAELFSATEQLGLRSAPAAAYWPFFHTIWTRKEAYAKALGMGLAVPFAEFSVLEPGLGGCPRLVAPAGARLQSFAAGAGYQGAVAVLTERDLPAAHYFRYPFDL